MHRPWHFYYPSLSLDGAGGTCRNPPVPFKPYFSMNAIDKIGVKVENHPYFIRVKKRCQSMQCLQGLNGTEGRTFFGKLSYISF